MEQFNPANIAGSFIQGRQSKLAEIADQHRMQLANNQEGRAQKQFQMGVDEAAMRKAQGLNTLATQVLPTVLEQIKANPDQAQQIYAQANQSMAKQAKQLGYSDEEIAKSVNAPFPGVQALEQVLGRAQTIEQQMAQRQNAEKMANQNNQFNQSLSLDKAQLDESKRHNMAAESISSANTGKLNTRPLSAKAIEDISKAGASVEQLSRLNQTFKDEYGGKVFNLYGDAENMVKQKMGDDTGQAQWWQDYQDRKNVIRNELFGTALTITEKAEFDKAQISPGMDAEQIRLNLARQAEAGRKAAVKLSNAWKANGASDEAVNAALGGAAMLLDSPVDTTGGQQQEAPTTGAIDRGANNPGNRHPQDIQDLINKANAMGK